MTDEAAFAVFGFTTTHDALAAERLLLAEGEDVLLIPTPRLLGTLCGFAARVPLERRELALALMQAAGVEPSGSIEMADRV